MGTWKTADGRRRWRQWTEAEARAALTDLAESGESLASFARGRGVSASRLRYWTKRLEESGGPSFVQVRLPEARPSADVGRVEIVVDDVSMHVPADMAVGRLAALVRALAGREPAC